MNPDELVLGFYTGKIYNVTKPVKIAKFEFGTCGGMVPKPVLRDEKIGIEIRKIKKFEMLITEMQVFSTFFRSVKGLNQTSDVTPERVKSNMNHLIFGSKDGEIDYAKSITGNILFQLIEQIKLRNIYNLEKSDKLARLTTQLQESLLDLLLDINYCFKLYFSFDFDRETKISVLDNLNQLYSLLANNTDINPVALGKIVLLIRNYEKKWMIN